MALILSSIVSLLGGGALTALITHFFNRKKVGVETDGIKITNIETGYSGLLNQIQQQNERLMGKVDKLEAEVGRLNQHIVRLYDWINTDNAAYISWLENEARKCNPNLTFPSRQPMPLLEVKTVSEG